VGTSEGNEVKKKWLLAGLAIGLLARPIVVKACRPLHRKVQTKIYNLAFDFIQNFDANNS
jgi:hypothetical protein